MSLRQKLLEKLGSLYPPFLGAGIKVNYDRKNGRVKVRMPLRWYNKNYVGTHYGGSLYSMCDPFFMLLLIKGLGKDYVVWDKEGRIEFLSPGKTTVYAEFFIPKEKIEEIKKEVDTKGKALPEFVVDVIDEEGKKVARVWKKIYVRKK
jgi:hypothetical protein